MGCVVSDYCLGYGNTLCSKRIPSLLTYGSYRRRFGDDNLELCHICAALSEMLDQFNCCVNFQPTCSTRNDDETARHEKLENIFELWSTFCIYKNVAKRFERVFFKKIWGQNWHT